MDPITLMAAMAAGSALMNTMQNAEQRKKDAIAMQVQAAKEQWTPWTKLDPGQYSPKATSGTSAFLQGGLAGAQTGATMAALGKSASTADAVPTEKFEAVPAAKADGSSGLVMPAGERAPDANPWTGSNLQQQKAMAAIERQNIPLAYQESAVSPLATQYTAPAPYDAEQSGFNDMYGRPTTNPWAFKNKVDYSGSGVEYPAKLKVKGKVGK